MKRLAVLALILVAAIWWWHLQAPVSPAPADETVALIPERDELNDMPLVMELNDPSGAAADDVRILHAMVLDFLTAVKEPYRPPLGINEDFARALTGGNRFGDVFIASNHPAVNAAGQLVDRWDTPYHFHPRAPDAIDVRSAGPDRILFTPDDVVSTRR